MKILTQEEYKSINENYIKNAVKQSAKKVYGLIVMMILLFALIFCLLYYLFDFFSITLLIIGILICAIFTYIPSVILILNWKINKSLLNEELEKALHYSNLFSKLTFNLLKESIIAIDITLHFVMNDEKYFEENISKISPNSPALVDTYFYQTLYDLKHKNFKTAIDNFDLLSKSENNEPHNILINALLEVFNYIKTNEKSAQLVNYQDVFTDAYFNSVLDTILNFTTQDKEAFVNLFNEYNK